MSKVEYDLDTSGGLMDVSREDFVFVQKMRLENGVRKLCTGIIPIFALKSF